MDADDVRRMNCEHTFSFLRRDVEEYAPVKKYFDVFFCTRCLVYQRILVKESRYNGDGRWIDHSSIQYQD